MKYAHLNDNIPSLCFCCCEATPASVDALVRGHSPLKEQVLLIEVSASVGHGSGLSDCQSCEVFESVLNECGRRYGKCWTHRRGGRCTHHSLHEGHRDRRSWGATERHSLHYHLTLLRISSARLDSINTYYPYRFGDQSGIFLLNDLYSEAVGILQNCSLIIGGVWKLAIRCSILLAQLSFFHYLDETPPFLVCNQRQHAHRDVFDIVVFFE